MPSASFQLLGLQHSCPSVFAARSLLIFIYICVVFLGAFTLFYKAEIIAPKLSMIFQGLIRRGSFPICWPSANVPAIPRRAPFPENEHCYYAFVLPILDICSLVWGSSTD